MVYFIDYKLIGSFLDYNDRDTIDISNEHANGSCYHMDCLPQPHDFQSYLRACLNLLKDWSWLYEHRNVDLLESRILDSPNASCLILLSELSLQDFNLIPQGFIKEEWPADLKKFVIECHLLKLNIPKFELLPLNPDKNLFFGMKEKKRDEVTKMSFLVSQTCSKYGIKHVVDIGCGLGYIGRILYHTYSLKVLGIEMDEEKVKRAMEKDSSIDFITAKLSKETLPQLASKITNWLNGDTVCLIALHCCGDLSVFVGNLFDLLSHAKCQIIIPCCYHRSLLLPLTKKLRNSGLLNTNLLRIATDTNAKRWEGMTTQQHTSHAMSVLSRNIIQLFPEKDKNEIKKKHRHLLRPAASITWDTCLQSCLERTSGLNEGKLRSIWSSQEWRINQVESYSCLQVCLQGVAEGLVILDILNDSLSKRNCDVRLLKLFNDIKSPRSIAIIITHTM